MPVSFAYKDLKNQDAGIGIRKIKSVEGLAPKVMYHATRLIQWIAKEEKIAQEIYQKMAHNLANKNEDGSLKTPEGHPQGSWEIKEENKEEFIKKSEEWASIEVINDKWEKLKASDLKLAKLSPGELMALEWLIDIESLVSVEPAPAKP